MSFTKICIQGICTSSALAVVSKCPFGDDVVVNQQTIYNQLPTTQMSCLTKFVLKKFEEYENLTCTDQSAACQTYAFACGTGAALNGVDINVVCPRTCGVCTSNEICEIILFSKPSFFLNLMRLSSY